MRAWRVPVPTTTTRRSTDDELVVPVTDSYKQTNGQLSVGSLAEFAPGPHVIMEQVLGRARC